jgi:lipoprotein signal peptidase
VELAQIAIVVLVLISSFFIIRILRRSKNSWEFLVGAMILSQALGMILERI